MRIITVTSEQDITALVHRVFTVPASSAQGVLAAVQALVDANPHLGGRTKIPAGTPIVVPDLPDLPPKVETSSSGSPFDDLQAQVRQALDYAKSAYEESGKRAVQSAKTSLEVLRAADFRRLAGAAKVSVASLTVQVNNAAKDADTQAKTQLANLGALTAALDELMRVIGAKSS